MLKLIHAHQKLHQLYPNLGLFDTMYPHVYTPLQSFLLEIVFKEETFLQNPEEETLLLLLQSFVTHNSIPLEDFVDELEQNPLLLRWIADFLAKLSPQTHHKILEGLESLFPFNKRSLKLLKVAGKIAQLPL